MIDHSESTDPHSIVIPAATTDEMLHALSASLIMQQATVNLMAGLLVQVYCQVTQVPIEAGEALRERLFSMGVASANEGFIGSLQERQQQVKDMLFH
ncbi:hypothetical protein [Hymenobacter swuensis]|uniref:Uncharacterized protein n=1 Tax=Hymenobacter swuensis DY53 TaxID=1227739 RepID=W8EQ56_9BACT|nr:hypothetical protein [Hymenobacter swuensis]AHJ95304.1 hypothetical protein Hsw_PB0014 [Hymenobacter swuensis DY53]